MNITLPNNPDKDNSNPAPMRIDVDQVLRQRLPRHYRYIPKGLVKWIERTICQEDMNSLLASNKGLTDADFCRGILRDLEVSYSVIGQEKLPPVSDRHVMFVSNHPLGGLDGMALIDFVNSVYGGEVKFVVNDLLTAIRPLKGTFVPINKHGHQSRQASNALDEAMAANNPVIVFPAGLVSRRQGDRICDLKWHKMFVNKAIQYHRTIIPLFFSGENSRFFYNFARLRTRLGLRFNIEMVYLPREVFRCRGSRFTITIGKPIAPDRLKGGKEAKNEAEAIKRIVYRLDPNSVENR